MNAKILRTWMLAGVATLALLAGCSSKNLPCDTDPSQIADAEGELASAKSNLESASSELQGLRSQKSDLQSKLNNVPDTAELEDRLEDLKKGSGR